MPGVCVCARARGCVCLCARARSLGWEGRRALCFLTGKREDSLLGFPKCQALLPSLIWYPQPPWEGGISILICRPGHRGELDLCLA